VLPAWTAMRASKNPYVRLRLLVVRASMTSVAIRLAHGSTRMTNRPVLSVRASWPSIASVTSGSGCPFDRSTRPETAVTPGGAISGASDSHGDGGRFVRQPRSPSRGFGVHASGSIAGSLAGRRLVVNRMDAATSLADRFASRSQILYGQVSSISMSTYSPIAAAFTQLWGHVAAAIAATTILDSVLRLLQLSE
jgi:hypothetical protein